MDIFIILMCLLFIILVIFQVTGANGLNNLTSGEETSTVAKKISFMTKLMFFLGILIFVLVFSYSFIDKNENQINLNSTTSIEKDSTNE